MLSRHLDYYEQLKFSYDELRYRQEGLGEYLNVFAGRVYYAYSEANESRFAILTARGVVLGLGL